MRRWCGRRGGQNARSREIQVFPTIFHVKQNPRFGEGSWRCSKFLENSDSTFSQSWTRGGQEASWSFQGVLQRSQPHIQLPWPPKSKRKRKTSACWRHTIAGQALVHAHGPHADRAETTQQPCFQDPGNTWPHHNPGAFPYWFSLLFNSLVFPRGWK